MTHKEKLYNNLRLAEKAYREAQESYNVIVKDEESKALEEKKKVWYNNYIVPFNNCEGKFYTSCAGHKWIYIEKIVNKEKYNFTYNCDFYKIENSPEYIGIELYYIEHLDDDRLYGRWDIYNGGTILIPDFYNKILTEVTKEEFMIHYNEYIQGIEKCKNYVNIKLINNEIK